MLSREMTGNSREKLFWLVHLLGLCAWGIDAPLLAQTDTTEKQSNLSLVLSLDLRRTRLEGNPAVIKGALTGLRFGPKGHILTLGYYWLGYDAPTRYIVWRGWLPRRIDLDYFTAMDARFVSLGYWYPLVNTPKWYAAIPVEFGYGGENTRYLGSILPEKGTSRFQLAQIGAYGSYRIVPWLGVNARFGYRHVLFDPKFSRQFSGIYYSYGLSFYPVAAYYELRAGHRKRMKKKGSL